MKKWEVVLEKDGGGGVEEVKVKKEEEKVVVEEVKKKEEEDVVVVKDFEVFMECFIFFWYFDILISFFFLWFVNCRNVMI